MKFLSPISAVMFLEGYVERGPDDAREAVAYLKQWLEKTNAAPAAQDDSSHD